jgi:toxin ParE1/3/4
MVEIIWTAQAHADLLSIESYIARDNPVIAERFIRRLIMQAGRLERWPNIGKQHVDFPDPALRQITVGAYRIIYLLRPDSVLIVKIHHGARLLLGDHLPDVR